MEARTEEPVYCGVYTTDYPYHWVIVWEEFGPWLERALGQDFPIALDDWATRGEATAAFFRRVFVRQVCLEIARCKINVALCKQGEAHMHVVLDDVVLKEGVSHE